MGGDTVMDCIYRAGERCSKILSDRQKDFIAGALFVIDLIEPGKAKLYAPRGGAAGQAVSEVQKMAADDLERWLRGAVDAYIGCYMECGGNADGQRKGKEN